MNTINLTVQITITPDFSGFKFYVQAGKVFDADDFADAYKLNRADLDVDDVHAAQDAAAQLNDGQWLEVSVAD